MTMTELTETPLKPVNVAVIERVLRDSGLPLGNNTTRVEIDYGRSEIVLHKVAEDDNGGVIPVRDGGETYFATYAVRVPFYYAA